MARYVITALGSAGDVYPFLAIGHALKARGHDVVLHASEYFTEKIEAAGLEFGGGSSRERFERLIRDPRLWHPTKAFSFVMREGIIPELPRLFEAIREEARRGDTVLVASSLDFASRIVRDLEPVKLATVHLAPVVFRSLYALPRLGTKRVPTRLPRIVKRLMWWAADRAFDPAYVPAINQLRAQHGLAPVHRPMKGWWHSPDLVLGLFPDWFGVPQPDWPAQLELTGFVRYDSRDALDPELDAWLDAGDPPILFTAGSANIQATQFLRESAIACERMGARGLLVSNSSAPEPLPDSIRHRSYVPFGAVLPRTAALVGHGGIGTCAQGLAAGVPQLVASMAHDQFDNAGRLEDLGVGAQLTHSQYTGARAAEMLRALLSSREVAEACLRARDRVEDGTPRVVAALERLLAD
ncbi:MAG: glycosyltransferase [Planctomycetota bacterium]|jgi:UDP:flavonoid glycosyltransferase YjiC (YdhE family)